MFFATVVRAFRQMETFRDEWDDEDLVLQAHKDFMQYLSADGRVITTASTTWFWILFLYWNNCIICPLMNIITFIVRLNIPLLIVCYVICVTQWITSRKLITILCYWSFYSRNKICYFLSSQASPVPWFLSPSWCKFGYVPLILSFPPFCALMLSFSSFDFHFLAQFVCVRWILIFFTEQGFWIFFCYSFIWFVVLIEFAALDLFDSRSLIIFTIFILNMHFQDHGKYRARKDTIAIAMNVLGVCANMQFIYVLLGWKGSVHNVWSPIMLFQGQMTLGTRGKYNLCF